MAENGTCRTRQEKTVAWATTHAGELAGVAVPLAAGAIWSPWLCLLSAGVAGVWARHEVLVARRTRPARQAANGALETARAPRLAGGTAEQSSEPAPADAGQGETTPGTERARREVSR